MNHTRAFFLIGIVGLIATGCAASAQTFQPGTKQVLGQSTATEDPSALSKVKIWTRGRWEAAKKHWVHDNAKFHACTQQWRQQTQGRKYTLHDQRDFLFHCMTDSSATQAADPPILARATSVTRKQQG
jgi:hypothetical protein